MSTKEDLISRLIIVQKCYPDLVINIDTSSTREQLLMYYEKILHRIQIKKEYIRNKQLFVAKSIFLEYIDYSRSNREFKGMTKNIVSLTNDEIQSSIETAKQAIQKKLPSMEKCLNDICSASDISELWLNESIENYEVGMLKMLLMLMGYTFD